MRFRILERESDEEVWIAKWPFPPRSQFIESHAYHMLMRELDRYVRGDVPGRSFLISGHRGSGKTSLVRQVVEDLNRSIFDRAEQSEKRTGSSRTDPRQQKFNLQRPLLVKLHGPGLLGPAVKPNAKPDESKSNEAAAKAVEPAAPAKKGDQGPAAAPTTNAAAPATAAEQGSAKPLDQTAFALVQITIGLYRALVTEFGKSFSNQVRLHLASQANRNTNKATDYLELAGQFTLDLDNAPRAAVLRGYYEKLGRIEAGVLWPPEFGKESLQSGVNDQGIREMLALVTAAQAFEICSGDITDKQTRKDSQSRDETAETKVEAGLKDVANKLLGLAAGLLVGVGSASVVGWTGGAAAGVATGLLSTLTLGWTSKRSRKDERLQDYTFIRRRDRETLERDLPLVIQRVREAGLAPVFVLDELDKLEDRKKSIAELIRNLKHLTTDFGFFCFLTDRDYYDYVTQKVTKEAFPVEHSFFSHRMFILHQPKPLLEYLGRITTSEAGTGSSAPSGPGDANDEAAARSSFGLRVLHRSKLNLIEVLRKIAEECEWDGRLRPTIAKLRADPGYRFEASIQLVVGQILRRPELRERVENEPRFMQRAIDALYMVSRAWEDEEPKVRVDRAAIVKCLLDRSGWDAADAAATAKPDASAPAATRGQALEKPPVAHKGKGSAKKDIDPVEKARREAEEARKAEADLLQTGMSVRDLDLVEGAVAMLADLLTDANRLKTWVADELKAELELDPASAPALAVLSTIFPPGNLVECVSVDRREYKFLADVYGQDLRTRAALQAAQAPAIAPIEPPIDTSTRSEDTTPPGDAGAAPPSTRTDAGTGTGMSMATGAGTALPTEVADEIRAVLAFMDFFHGVLLAAGTSMLELVGLHVLPPVDAIEFDEARNRLQESVRGNRPYSGLSRDLPLVRSLVAYVQDNGRALAILFRVALGVAGRARPRRLRMVDALLALARYTGARFDDPQLWDGISDLPPEFHDRLRRSTRDIESLTQWRDQMLELRERSYGSTFSSLDARRIWSAAGDPVVAYLVKGSALLEPLQYDYIICAAAGMPPGNLLRRDFREMTAAEWSRLCLEGFPAGSDQPGPLWAFVAGLCAMGFDRRILDRAAQLESRDKYDRPDICRNVAEVAPSAGGAGFIFIMRDDGASIAEKSNYRQRRGSRERSPFLALPERSLKEYTMALEWLLDEGAITRLVYEIEEGGLPE